MIKYTIKLNNSLNFAIKLPVRYTICCDFYSIYVQKSHRQVSESINTLEYLHK